MTTLTRQDLNFGQGETKHTGAGWRCLNPLIQTLSCFSSGG